MRTKPLYEAGDTVIVNEMAGADNAYGLMPGPAVPGRTGIVQRVKLAEGATPRYRVRFDYPELAPMQVAVISWLRELSLDPVNPHTLRQQVRATKQLTLF